MTDLLASLGVSSFEFRDPLFLFTAFLAPLVYWFAARLPARIIYSSLAIAEQAPRSLRARLAQLPALLLALAALCLAVALAGPRTGDTSTKVKREGIAMLLVVDRSGSMEARDFVQGDYSVSRLEAVKGVFQSFIRGGEAGQGRPNDLIGVVAFGTYADSICPLTLDHANLSAILNEVKVTQQSGESATAIGEGLGLAIERLRQHHAKSKVIILLTDGVNNAGELDPLQAADLAAQHGIKIYSIGAGQTGYAPFPVQGRDGRIHLRKILVEMDSETLQAIAQRTGGRYFPAEDKKALTETYAAIDQLERSEITEILYMQYREHYSPWVLAALLLLASSGLANGLWLRRLP